MNIRTFVTILSRKAQCNFPKMRGGGGVKSRLELFRKFIRSVNLTRPLGRDSPQRSFRCLDSLYPLSQHCLISWSQEFSLNFRFDLVWIWSWTKQPSSMSGICPCHLQISGESRLRFGLLKIWFSEFGLVSNLKIVFDWVLLELWVSSHTVLPAGGLFAQFRPKLFVLKQFCIAVQLILTISDQSFLSCISLTPTPQAPWPCSTLDHLFVLRLPCTGPHCISGSKLNLWPSFISDPSPPVEIAPFTSFLP